MGWKISTVIIQQPGEVDKEKVLQALGFNNLTKFKDEPFDIAMNPHEGVFIGYYGSNLLICDSCLRRS